MTDEEFDTQVEAIGHVLRLGHIVESRLGGHVDEQGLAEALEGAHAKADARRAERERLRDADKAEIARLEAELARAKAERDAARERLSQVASLIGAPEDGGESSEAAGPEDVGAPMSSDDACDMADAGDSRTLEHDGVTYVVVEDPDAIPRTPGHPKPVLIDGMDFFPSANQAAIELMPDGANSKSEATAVGKAARKRSPWRGHTVEYLVEA